MVRVNLINPKHLADQHLIAEYVEILMLIQNIKKYNSLEDIPLKYCLGKGHMKFFRDKVNYLVKRHELIKKEMKKRGFNVNKKIDLQGLKKQHLGNWKASERDMKIIKKRLLEKIKLKPCWYRYYKEKKNFKFFKELIENAG